MPKLPPGVVFDRCPADYLSYLAVLRGNEGVADETARAARAMASLDLIVFVPIERPDRVRPAADEDRRLRVRVDRVLRALVVEGALRMSASMLEVSGAVNDPRRTGAGRRYRRVTPAGRGQATHGNQLPPTCLAHRQP